MSRAAAMILVALAAAFGLGIVSRGAAVGAGQNAWPQAPATAPRGQAVSVVGGAAGTAGYWVVEFRRRWKAERRASHARAREIRVLRARLRATARQPYGNHRLEAAFLCIHAHEGRWADPAPPYYGGLQMDRDFQLAYGRPYVEAFGWADRWPVSVQLAVAIRAYLDRGFQPWPNTARMCGLP